MRRIYFFATPEDIIPVLNRFAANEPIKFVVTGDSITPDRSIYFHVSEIPDPGVATHETGFNSVSYMISLRDTKNHMRKSVGNDGNFHWDLYNGDNEETVVLTMAGIWKDGTLLPGLISTLHQNTTAQQLMKWFLAALKTEGFAKIESWWVGREAMEMLRSGKRLTTTAVQSPPQFDLKMPE